MASSGGWFCFSKGVGRGSATWRPYWDKNHLISGEQLSQCGKEGARTLKEVCVKCSDNTEEASEVMRYTKACSEVTGRKSVTHCRILVFTE